MTTYDFSGQTVLISGAAAGFGLAAARRFHAAGASLVLTDYRDDMLDGARAILGTPDTIRYAAGDVAIMETHRMLVELACSAFGRLDIAINNAGIAHPQKRLEDIDEAEARRVLEVDTMGIFLAMKAQLPVMQRQFAETGHGGVILNTASVAGIVGAPTMSVYSAAKHAVVGLTKSAAIENARKGIRINALCPAFARTNMVEVPLQSSPKGREQAEARLVSNMPMARIGEVDEIVQAMLWACSPENSFYTGQAVIVDGGLSAG